MSKDLLCEFEKYWQFIKSVGIRRILESYINALAHTIYVTILTSYFTFILFYNWNL